MYLKKLNDKMRVMQNGHSKTLIMLSISVISFYLLTCCGSCKPKISSFTTDRKIVGESDSIHVNWITRGSANLTVLQKRIPQVYNDSAEALEFVLIATRGQKKTAPRVIQVVMVPEIIKNRLAFPLVRQTGDTLIAAGQKDTAMWSGFEIVSMVSVLNRRLIVIHQGRKVELPDSVFVSTAFKGMDYAGAWEFQSLLSDKEKQDKSLVPDLLQLQVIVRLKK